MSSTDKLISLEILSRAHKKLIIQLLVTFPKFIVPCFPVLGASAVHSEALIGFPPISYIDE